MTVEPYGECLGSLLFSGAQKGKDCLQPMVLMAEQLLALPPARLSRLLWRLDAGFGTDAGINWLLPRRGQLLVKGFNNRRAKKVVGQVPDEDWVEVGPRKWAAPVPNVVRYGKVTHGDLPSGGGGLLTQLGCLSKRLV